MVSKKEINELENDDVRSFLKLAIIPKKSYKFICNVHGTVETWQTESPLLVVILNSIYSCPLCESTADKNEFEGMFGSIPK